MFSLDDAKKYVLTQVLKYNPDVDRQHRPKIMDNYTIERPFGWVFIYNNEAHVEDNRQPAWGGPGPIIFNKWTGEVRRFNATFGLAEVAEDYEKEIEAGEGCWVLFIGTADTKKIALTLKHLFAMNGVDSLQHAKRVPGPLFKGKWRELLEFAPKIPGSKVQVSGSKEPNVPVLKSLGFDRWNIGTSD